jgi:hypothetical protein
VSITVFRLTDVFHIPSVVFLTIARPTVLPVLPSNRRRLDSFMMGVSCFARLGGAFKNAVRIIIITEKT